MKRTTIFVPEALERELQLYAARQRRPVASVVREALAEYVVSRRPASALPSFTAVGASGRTDVSERHEEMLWSAPHRGESNASRRAPRAHRRRAARKRRR
jgi:predicted transcriptional regulator